MSSRYRKKLAEDLPRWVDAGWVMPEGARAILAEVAAQEPDRKNRFVGILSILGAVLIGAGVISFVAANWQEMPRLFRLGLMISLLWAAYGTAAFLFARGLSLFAHGAVLVGSVVFGASVMLVAQMYHLHGNPPDAVIVWSAGALVAGLLMRSNPSLVLSLLLVCLWGGWETQLREAVFWPFLAAWGAVFAALMWRECAYGLKLATLALGVWIVSLAYTLPEPPQNELVLAIGAAIGCFGIALQFAGRSFEVYGRLAVALGFGVAIVALLGLQFIDWRRELGSVIGLAVVTLMLSLAALGWALRTEDRWLLRAAFLAFSIEVVCLYGRTLGTLMNTSVFFLGAGVFVIALALLAFWLNGKLGGRLGART